MSNCEKEIQNLINICEDARTFYDHALDKTDDKEMARLYRQMSDIRQSIIIDLRAFMRRHDMEVKVPSETIMGQVNKYVGKTLANIFDETDEALVAYLEEAEDRCLHSFESVANDNDMPAEARLLVKSELETLQQTHDFMRELKHKMAKAA